MIEGEVSADYEPVITLTLWGPSGRTRDLDAVVDTGYNGFLSLALGWPTEIRSFESPGV